AGRASGAGPSCATAVRGPAPAVLRRPAPGGGQRQPRKGRDDGGENGEHDEEGGRREGFHQEQRGGGEHPERQADRRGEGDGLQPGAPGQSVRLRVQGRAARAEQYEQQHGDPAQRRGTGQRGGGQGDPAGGTGEE